MKLLVCDMAGTIINERGIVYKTLLNTLKKIGVKNELYWWYGLEKKEVIDISVDRYYTGKDKKEMKKSLHMEFLDRLDSEYFDKGSNISLIDPKIPDYFAELRNNGCKIALNTSYNRNIQEKLIDKLELNDYIDDYISSEDVVAGRPYPYMIFKLRKRHDIKLKDIVKIGDTKNDIAEGKYSSCGLTVGVLSGCGSKSDLEEADFIHNKITDFDYLNILNNS